MNSLKSARLAPQSSSPIWVQKGEEIRKGAWAILGETHSQDLSPGLVMRFRLFLLWILTLWVVIGGYIRSAGTVILYNSFVRT